MGVVLHTKMVVGARVRNRIELRTSEAGLKVDATGEEQGCITCR